eukprot:1427043-Lingulodinium_polyedra.AAC.1
MDPVALPAIDDEEFVTPAQSFMQSRKQRRSAARLFSSARGKELGAMRQGGSGRGRRPVADELMAQRSREPAT